MSSAQRAPQHFAVIGAGMAGITCARTLVQAGHQVTIFEKSRSTSGRMATRSSPFGSFDHGAQYFTARDPRFLKALETTPKLCKRWSANSVQVLDEMGHVAGPGLSNHDAHWVAVPGMCDRLSSRFGIRTFAENPFPSPMAVIANAPAVAQTPFKKITENTELAGERPIVDVEDDSAWVSAFVGPLTIDEAASDRNIPRLIARMQWTRPEQRWPAPHNIWPSTSRWPEYRLEVDDLDWAAGEVASALDSMRCPIKPITEDGNWWC